MLKRNFWQKKLQLIVKQIENRKEFLKDTYNIDAELEFNIMSGFYIIRKLNEHKKLTNKFISTNIKGNKYPFLEGKRITPFNDHKWPEFYDFNNKLKAKFDVIFLCNQFVHSFYFINYEEFVDRSINENLENINDDEYYKLCKTHKRKHQKILFNSDDTKFENLFEIEIDKIVSLFKEVSLMDITKISIIYNQKKDKYDYFQSDEKMELPEELK
ncbi:hypothetical protein [Empedobacter tilapiae]|uniref:hypothetical protein n=1 Tax=Empedobacter tilapiae TaxID=2491114 RepID=UPI0028D513BC|nr:hypothetical protein [Empedobacter tilapiae]